MVKLIQNKAVVTFLKKIGARNPIDHIDPPNYIDYQI